MNILEKIAINKRMEIEELKINFPLEQIQKELPATEPHRFKRVLEASNTISIIAEIKKGSPSRGIISEDFDPLRLAELYCDGGAAALSVLTESKFFYGDYNYIRQIKKQFDIPVLCKDFILDPYQVYHAKWLGADAILLIIRLLTKEMLSRLYETAMNIGIDVLVETHDEHEVQTALDNDVDIIGVNNRNLETFDVDIQTAVKLSGLIPDSKIKVAESGIFSKEDVRVLREAGYSSLLIGEALVKAEKPDELIRELRSI